MLRCRMWFPLPTEHWQTPPAPPMGLPLAPLAPLSVADPSVDLCLGSPWLSDSSDGDWDGLFYKIGVIWPLRSAAAALDYGTGFDELHLECGGGPASTSIDVHIPIVEESSLDRPDHAFPLLTCPATPLANASSDTRLRSPRLRFGLALSVCSPASRPCLCSRSACAP